MRRPRNPLPPFDRRALERQGWRTLLDYREDHIRDDDGVLMVVIPRWTAEAEREGGAWLTASAPEARAAWALLRRAAADVDRRERRERRERRVRTAAA